MSSFDPAAALTRYLPSALTTTRINLGSTASAWVQMNFDAFPRYFTISTTAAVHIEQGHSDMVPVTTGSFFVPEGIHDFVIKEKGGISVLLVDTSLSNQFLTLAETGV